MAAKRFLTLSLADEQMRALLADGTALVFEGRENKLEAIERQVERLGFGDRHLVARTKGPPGTLTKVTPMHSAAAACV